MRKLCISVLLFENLQATELTVELDIALTNCPAIVRRGVVNMPYILLCLMIWLVSTMVIMTRVTMTPCMARPMCIGLPLGEFVRHAVVATPAFISTGR